MELLGVEQKIEPILKWPGGKFEELKFILPAMPDTFHRYFEPFLGGGAVYLSVPSQIPAYVNDKSYDLINLYCQVTQQDDKFFATLENLICHWRNLETILENDNHALIRQYIDYRSGEIDERILKRIVNALVDNNIPNIEDDLNNHFHFDIPFYIRSLRNSLTNKMRRMRKLERKKGNMSEADISDNLEAAIKASFYYYMRYLYNYASKFQIPQQVQAAIFFFVRENAYGSMFRFNKQGHFNIPFGGISYSRKNIEAKIEKLKSPTLLSRLNNTDFGNQDFKHYMDAFELTTDDFIFLDPPYDTEFSSYDQNPFAQSDQKRLADFLIDDCEAKFMLVIKATDFISSLYEDTGLNIRYFDKKYMYNVKERNNREVVHLLITNY